MDCVPEQRSLSNEHQCLHSGCPHRVTDLQRFRLESISLCRGLLAAWKLVFYLTCSPPRVEMQPEIFQEPSAHSIIQLCSSVRERELNNTVPLKCVPIGSTVFPRRDIEERCVIPGPEADFHNQEPKTNYLTVQHASQYRSGVYDISPPSQERPAGNPILFCAPQLLNLHRVCIVDL